MHYQYAEHLARLPLDVTDAASIAAAVLAVQAHNEALGVLINNGGVYPHAGSGDAHQRLGQLTHNDALETLMVNVIGPLLVAQALLPLLRAGRKGRILSISSGQGSLTWKATGAPATTVPARPRLTCTCATWRPTLATKDLFRYWWPPAGCAPAWGGDTAT